MKGRAAAALVPSHIVVSGAAVAHVHPEMPRLVIGRVPDVVVPAAAGVVAHAAILVEVVAFAGGRAFVDDELVVVRAAGALVVGLAVALPRLVVQPVERAGADVRIGARDLNRVAGSLYGRRAGGYYDEPQHRSRRARACGSVCGSKRAAPKFQAV